MDLAEQWLGVPQVNLNKFCPFVFVKIIFLYCIVKNSL